MQLILLGTSGYHPSDRRQTACLLLPECGVMLDAGTGAYRAGEYLKTPELDIFITHAHLDHVIGLTYLFSVLRSHRLDRVRLHGLPDKLAAVERHLFSEDVFPSRPPFQLCPLAPTVPIAGGGRLTHFPLEHPGGSIGFRIDWPDRSMAYVTDTAADLAAPYVEQIRGVDLLVHECYFADDQAGWATKLCHSHTTPVVQVAREAGVKRLVLVHLNPLSTSDDPIGLSAARSVFPNTLLGEDRMALDF